MKKIITLLLLLQPLVIHAYSSEIKLDEVDIDLTDYAALKRGAEHYATYCLGCHSAKHIRYLRIAEDFNLDQEQVLKDIAPEGAIIYDSMRSAMNVNDAEIWFGTKPPDLSLIARSRGADWLYTYLRGFYADDSKPLGTNNLVFEDVGMPNVLYTLQGKQELAYKQIGDTKVYTGLKITKPGKLSEGEFNQFTTELVNFLVYVGEPSKLQRVTMGKYVLLFIFLFIVIAYLLKKEYWKDIH